MWNWYDKHQKSIGSPATKDKFAGMMIAYERINVDTDERIHDIGTILFCKGSLGGGLIAHEIGHAAFWYDRLINGSDGCYGTSIGDDEERLLYLLAELTRDCVDKMYQKGIL